MKNESQEQDVFPKMPSEYLQTDLEFSFSRKRRKSCAR